LLSDDLVVACGTGAVRLTKLQKAGGKPLASADFLRGTPLAKGTRLS
jgi:methionyl-tRNA formyltransferase